MFASKGEPVRTGVEAAPGTRPAPASMNQSAPTLLLLDHARQGLDQLVPLLERQGYRVLYRNDILESLALARAGTAPELVLFAPLVLDPRGVEAELLVQLGREGTTPVLLVVDDLDKLERAGALPVPIRDFVTLPLQPREVALRIAGALRVRRELLALRRRTEELTGQVIRDFKTGLYNARHFAQELRREFQRVLRTRRPLALLLLDIDDFKKINDGTEYAFGDRVLAEFARKLQASIREVDLAARFGGDEFMVLLPGTTPAEAIQVASRIHNTVARMEVSEGPHTARITVSIGVDCFNGHSASTPEEFRSRANRALQEAKRRGKNCIWLHAEPFQAAPGDAPEA